MSALEFIDDDEPSVKTNTGLEFIDDDTDSSASSAVAPSVAKATDMKFIDDDNEHQPNPNVESAAKKLSGVKEGDFVAVTGRDGKIALKKMNAPSDGASVLEDVDDVPDINKTYPTLSADEYDAAREHGKVKMNVSPSRYAQLQHIAETGSETFDGENGAFMSAYADTMPFGGGKVVDKERGKIARMEKYIKGEPDLAPYSKIARESTPTSLGPTKYVSPFSKQTRPLSDDEQWAEEARMLGVDGDLKRGENESTEDYHKRLQGLVEGKMKETVANFPSSTRIGRMSYSVKVVNL